MSDFDTAVQRLTAWLRDYGDQKPRPFVEDITIVLLAAKDSVRQQAELERLRSGAPEGFIGLTSELRRVAEQLDTCRALLREAYSVPGVRYVLGEQWVEAARAAGGDS